MAEQLICIDTLLFTVINGHHCAFLDRLFLIITQLGTGYVVGPLMFIVVFWRVPPPKRWPVVVICALAMSLTGVCNTSLKRTVGRGRPLSYYSGVGRRETGGNVLHRAPRGPVHVVGKVLRAGSFPSGHAATAFSAATILVFLFGKLFAWSYLAAVLVGYSRIYMGVHFPLDVAAGAVEGAGVTLALLILLNKAWSKYGPGKKQPPVQRNSA
jgi:membrane-associated phospholipid phosphatase